ncbi:MAG: hypothetical protein MJ102_09905 [Clostridia bacterium]|nr:hypothetical protein [Clostridia bacterium]
MNDLTEFSLSLAARTQVSVDSAAYAKELFQKPVWGIIDGFHLKEVNEWTRKVIPYLETLEGTELYPCYCTSFAVWAAIHQKIPSSEVSVGIKITW